MNYKDFPGDDVSSSYPPPIEEGMKVYAVIERCDDDYYPDYTIVDDCVYLKEEDAEKKLDELFKERYCQSAQFEIYDFEVKE